MAFIDYLIEYCNKNHITAYELSKKSGVSMTYCYRLLNRQMINPSIKIIQLISIALDINYAEFIKDIRI